MNSESSSLYVPFSTTTRMSAVAGNNLRRCKQRNAAFSGGQFAENRKQTLSVLEHAGLFEPSTKRCIRMSA
jgi:hypothetical protein